MSYSVVSGLREIKLVWVSCLHFRPQARAKGGKDVLGYFLDWIVTALNAKATMKRKTEATKGHACYSSLVLGSLTAKSMIRLTTVPNVILRMKGATGEAP